MIYLIICEADIGKPGHYHCTVINSPQIQHLETEKGLLELDENSRKFSMCPCIAITLQNEVISILCHSKGKEFDGQI